MKAKKFQDGEDRVEGNSNQNDEIKINFNDDYRYFSRSSIGILIQDKYCKCGRVRSAYDEKLSNYGVKTNDFYGIDKLASKLFELNNKNAIYLTKKSLMLNQFLEYNETSAAVTACQDSSPNRLNFNATKNQFECSALDMLQCPQSKNSRTLCLPSSLFLDKRLVNLFRSVALYWFFCLNTVLAKGEIYKRKTLTVIDLYKTDPISPFDANLEINISPDILQNLDYSGNNFLWKRRSTSLLSYAENSLETFLDRLRSEQQSFIMDVIESVRDESNWTEDVSDSEDIANNECDESSSNQNNRRKRAVKNRTTVCKRLCMDDRNEQFHPLPNENSCSDEEIIEILGNNTTSNEYEGIEGVESLKENSDADEPKDDKMDVDVDRPNGIKIPAIGAELPVARMSSQSLEISKNNGNTSSSSELAYKYYLPQGMLNGEDYPIYNLWNGISIDGLLRQQPLGNLNQQNNGRNPPPPLERNDTSILNSNEFRSYRLWESTTNADDDYIPNFNSNANLSVYSMPYSPLQSAAVGGKTKPSTETKSVVKRNAKRSTETESGVYSLWQSPNIIDCLNSRRDPQSLNSQRAPVGRTSSVSSERNDSAEGRYLMSFKPDVTKYRTLTDMGAFKYYDRSLNDSRRLRADLLDTGNGIPNNTNVEITTSKVTVVHEFQDLTSSNIFEPIQPDVGVSIDMPAVIDRSRSGTMLYNNRMLLTYKREMDSICNPLNLFQPKFIVRGTNTACQTDSNEDEAGSSENSSEIDVESEWEPLNLSRRENVLADERPNLRNFVGYNWDGFIYLTGSDMENSDVQTPANSIFPIYAPENHA